MECLDEVTFGCIQATTTKKSCTFYIEGRCPLDQKCLLCYAQEKNKGLFYLELLNSLVFQKTSCKSIIYIDQNISNIVIKHIYIIHNRMKNAFLRNQRLYSHNLPLEEEHITAPFKRDIRRQVIMQCVDFTPIFYIITGVKRMPFQKTQMQQMNPRPLIIYKTLGVDNLIYIYRLYLQHYFFYYLIMVRSIKSS